MLDRHCGARCLTAAAFGSEVSDRNCANPCKPGGQDVRFWFNHAVPACPADPDRCAEPGHRAVLNPGRVNPAGPRRRHGEAGPGEQARRSPGARRRAPTRPARPPPRPRPARPRSPRPREVRAIGGDGSATVVWCPPASGAGSVVSYTVDLVRRPARSPPTCPTTGRSSTASPTAPLHVHRHRQHRRRVRPAAAATTGPVDPGPLARAPAASCIRPAAAGQLRPVLDAASAASGCYITAGEFDPWRTPSPVAVAR